MFENFLKKSMILYKRPRSVLIAAGIITIIFLAAIPHLKLDNDLTNMIPDTHESKITFKKYEKIFGSSSLIFIGIEADNIYTAEVLSFIQNLTAEIKNLNRTIPPKNMARLLDITEQEATSVISVISETYPLGTGEVQAALSDPERLENEFFIEKKLASKISSRVKKTDLTRLMDYYALPIKEVTSIVDADYIEGSGDTFIVKKLLDEGPLDYANISQLKQRINSWSFYRGGLVSYDESLTTILVRLYDVDQIRRTAVYHGLKEILEKSDPKGLNLYLDGESVIADTISEYIVSDVSVLLPLVVIVVMIALFLFFRNLQGVLFPFAAVAMTTIVGVGFMSFCGVPINLVSTMMPVLLIAVGSAYGIHFMNHYFLYQNNNKENAIRQNNTSVGMAIIMAGVTTVAGFGSLATSGFIPIRNFGIFTAVGIFICVAITIYIMPCLILVSPVEKLNVVPEKNQKDRVHLLLSAIDRLVKKYYLPILVVTIIMFGLFIYGISLVKVEVNNIAFFKKSSALHIADDKLNQKLAGTQVLNIILESRDSSAVLSPSLLKKMDRFETELMQNFDIVKKIVSVNPYLKKMNQEMYGGDPAKHILPETEDKINDYLLLYSGDLEPVITSSHDKVRITVSMKRSSTQKIKEIKEFTEKFFSPAYLAENNCSLVITGYAYLYLVANTIMVNGQMSSLLFSIVIVFILIMLIFKKFVMSMIGLVPIILTIVVNFGIMGYTGITLNGATAMTSAVAIGIGIDYAIHFITWYRKEMNDTGDVSLSITRSIVQKGRGIFFNLFSVAAGFLVMCFSRFVPLIQFGLLISLSMLITGFGAVIIIPSILLLIHRKSMNEGKR
ncbi:MAG TPA: MMPL family transporter [Spirochaetota bacterium]|nr:MMPL family transporter [Spirochaetota bacterium]HPI90756.1 MMPL family transporter [Spirochaetota bacterium]HPR49369.1 MMPL family transporter [Spirochaetota bacterium]